MGLIYVEKLTVARVLVAKASCAYCSVFIDVIMLMPMHWIKWMAPRLCGGFLLHIFTSIKWNIERIARHNCVFFWLNVGEWGVWFLIRDLIWPFYFCVNCRYEVDKTASFVWGEWHVLKCFTKALALVNRCVLTIKKRNRHTAQLCL